VRLHRVKNVSEAVALAEEFKRNGTHDWFRGQVSNWPLKSSYVRLKEEQLDETMQKLGRFEHWAKQTPGLESLAGHVDSLVAVAQHYGLPTNFVDFTTEPEVAGFFASHGKPTQGMDSCIMCLDTKDLKDFWSRMMPPQYRPPEFITLEVANLWRLEAQHGTFLFCPYNNFEAIYDLDRIIFPYTGTVSKPGVEEMYPKRKSNLEILLDQYFMNEKLLEGERTLQTLEFFRNAHRVAAPEHRCDPELVAGGHIPRDASWDAVKLDAWLTPRTEKLAAAVTEEKWDVVVNADKGPRGLAGEISDYVARRLRDDAGARGKLIRFMFRSGDAALESALNNYALPSSVQRLWDGLRTLPYDDEDIAAGVGNCVALYMCGRNALSESHDFWRAAASACFGDAMEVEFGSDDGSYSRAYVSESGLLGAVRDDIADFLSPEWRDALVGNMTGLLQAVQSPERLFVFERLCKVFAREVAASQVLMRQDEHSAAFFSPARLEAIGLP